MTMILVCALCIGLIVTIVSFNACKETKLEVGQYWKCAKRENPFDSSSSYWEVKILAIQNGWVKVRRGTGQIDSYTEDNFRILYPILCM